MPEPKFSFGFGAEVFVLLCPESDRRTFLPFESCVTPARRSSEEGSKEGRRRRVGREAPPSQSANQQSVRRALMHWWAERRERGGSHIQNRGDACTDRVAEGVGCCHDIRLKLIEYPSQCLSCFLSRVKWDKCPKQKRIAHSQVSACLHHESGKG